MLKKIENAFWTTIDILQFVAIGIGFLACLGIILASAAIITAPIVSL